MAKNGILNPSGPHIADFKLDCVLASDLTDKLRGQDPDCPENYTAEELWKGEINGLRDILSLAGLIIDPDATRFGEEETLELDGEKWPMRRLCFEGQTLYGLNGEAMKKFCKAGRRWLETDIAFSVPAGYRYRAVYAPDGELAYDEDGGACGAKTFEDAVEEYFPVLKIKAVVAGEG